MRRRYARDFSAIADYKTDLIVNQLPGGLFGYDLAQKLGVPLILAGVIPLARTSAFPMLAFPRALRHIPGYNVTGYWFPQEEAWQPPDDLRHFIEAGPPAIFIGFGSMPLRHPRQTTAFILEALARSGQRAILHAGWAGLAEPNVTQLPPHVFAIDYAPYRWLFPRTAAVVHHGGSGTTAAGLRAGVPALVVPFLFDQHFWGRRLADLGVAPPPLPFGRLTAETLAQAMSAAARDEEMRRRAAALGHKIRAENGLEAAVSVVRHEIAA